MEMSKYLNRVKYFLEKCKLLILVDIINLNNI